MKYNYTKEEFKNIVINSLSIADICLKLNIKSSGGNYQTIKKRIKQWKLDISHFVRKGGFECGVNNYKKPKDLNQILIKGYYYSSAKLRQRLLFSGIKEHICENCKNVEWLGNKIPLELHHINGERDDNTIENIQLLCPNCHSLTSNYRGRKNKKRKNKKLIKFKEDISKVKRESKFKELYDKLHEIIWLMPSSTIAKQYGLSDSAIVKACKKLNISKPPVGYWAKKKYGKI